VRGGGTLSLQPVLERRPKVLDGFVIGYNDESVVLQDEEGEVIEEHLRGGI